MTGPQILQLRARQLKVVRRDAHFFFSFRRMAIKPQPVLVAIRRKLPFGKLKSWLEFSTFSPYLSPLRILQGAYN